MRSLGSLGTGFAFLDARDDFRRARRRHALVYIARCLLGRRRRPLRALADAAAVGGQPRLRVIALDSIVGAMESLSCFDDGFRPSSETARQRWERIALAHRTGIALPPIEVLEHPDGIYVIDGCHRVSVARALGHSDIEARVRRPPQPTIADTVPPSAARAFCTLTAGVRAEPHTSTNAEHLHEHDAIGRRSIADQLMDGGDPEAGLKADAAAVTLAQLGTNGGNNAGVHGSHAASVTARPASCFPSHASTRSHRRRDPNGVSVQPAHAPPQGPATGS